jgi:hypothetical protein
MVKKILWYKNKKFTKSFHFLKIDFQKIPEKKHEKKKTHTL